LFFKEILNGVTFGIFYATMTSYAHIIAPIGKVIYNQGIVANQGCFIPDPDPTIAPSQIRIPDPGGKKAPDPGSDLFLYKGY
jgi:hypothetical protein